MAALPASRYLCVLLLKSPPHHPCARHSLTPFPAPPHVAPPPPGDTLNGHVDDAERDLAQPLVSLSLGCEAAFLMGGPSKQGPPPTALLLRSGDAVVLSGPARRCHHGLPRIFTDRPLPESLSCSGSEEGGCSGSGGAGPEFGPFARHMQGCRINISIRHTL